MDKYNIIHLEDEEDTVILSQRALTKAGLTYRSVKSLADLEELLQTARADLYVLDGSFPFQPGNTELFLADKAFAKIRKIHPQAKILIYSGNDPKKFADLSGIEYLSKDNSPDNLAQKVRSMLE